MKKILIVFALLFTVLAVRNYVLATNDKCFCHNVNNNPHTICTSNQGQINGHMGHVNNGEDTEGECSVNVHSPTPSITPTEEPSVTPTGDPTSTPEATLTPTNEPTPTTFHPSATPGPNNNAQPQGTNQIPTGGGEPNKGIWK